MRCCCFRWWYDAYLLFEHRAEDWPHWDHARQCVCAGGGVNVVSATGFHVLDTDAPENPLSGCFWWARMEGCGSHGYQRWRRKTDSLTKMILSVESVTSVQFNVLYFEKLHSFAFCGILHNINIFQVSGGSCLLLLISSLWPKPADTHLPVPGN